jgi:hypothetical protein
MRNIVKFPAIVAVSFLGIVSVELLGSEIDWREWFKVRRTAESMRPDIVKPKLGMTLPRGETYPVTVYEYADRDHFIATGRTLTYSFSPAYYYNALLPEPGASALHFLVGFDLETSGPWLKAPLRRPGLDAERRLEASRRKVEAIISPFEHLLPESRHLEAAKARGPVAIADISTISKSCWDDYNWIGRQYCGFEMFEQCTRDNPLARAEQIYPFNSASIFARPDGRGGYDRVIECNHSSELGWCSTDLPHPIAKSFRINFGGANLCRWEQAVFAAERIFADHLTGATGPREGWGKPYGAYGEDQLDD